MPLDGRGVCDVHPYWAAEPDLGDLVHRLFAERRHRRGLPRHAVAERLGVAASTVVAWESGRDAPSLRHLIRWANLFDLRLAICDEHGDRSLPEIVLREGEDWDSGEVRRLMATLYDIRRVRRLTQSTVGELLGVTGPAVLRWEQAHRRPPLVTLVRWVRELGCVVQLRSMDSLWRLEHPDDAVYD
jgi:transcriptional regulator with XRE-family HTH domain